MCMIKNSKTPLHKDLLDICALVLCDKHMYKKTGKNWDPYPNTVALIYRNQRRFGCKKIMVQVPRVIDQTGCI